MSRTEGTRTLGTAPPPSRQVVVDTQEDFGVQGANSFQCMRNFSMSCCKYERYVTNFTYSNSTDGTLPAFAILTRFRPTSILRFTEDGSSESGDIPRSSVTPGSIQDGSDYLVQPPSDMGDREEESVTAMESSDGGVIRGGDAGDYHCEACGSVFSDLTGFMAHRNYECLSGKRRQRLFPCSQPRNFVPLVTVSVINYVTRGNEKCREAKDCPGCEWLHS